MSAKWEPTEDQLSELMADQGKRCGLRKFRRAWGVHHATLEKWLIRNGFDPIDWKITLDKYNIDGVWEDVKQLYLSGNGIPRVCELVGLPVLSVGKTIELRLKKEGVYQGRRLEVLRKNCGPVKKARWKDEPIKSRRISLLDLPLFAEKEKERRKAANYVTWKKRYRNDFAFRVMKRLRNQLRKFVTGEHKRSMSDLVGCTRSELLAYLESLFEHGMTWENYGVHGWHIDHIVPIKLFDLTQDNQLRACWHYSNLAPRWALDNIRKGATYEEPAVMKCSVGSSRGLSFR